MGYLLHWSPKILKTFVGFTTLVTLVNFGWLIMLSVQTFQPIIVFYRRGIFVYHHLGFLIRWLYNFGDFS